MFVRPRVLAILTTRRCTAACDHCCVGSSPTAAGAIPVRRIHELIDEAKRVPTIRRIVFTGGEAFLLGAALDALIAHAHALEFDTRAITNGYWAVSETAARSRVERLREAGLDEIMLSTGTFHARFVPLERVVRAARATTAADIPTRISIEDCDQSRVDDAIFRRALSEPLERGTLTISHDPWIPDAGGRGSAALTYDTLRARGRDGSTGGCVTAMTTLSVTPDQELLACCGFPMEELPGLRIGSVANRALDEVILEAPNDLLKMMLHVDGPAGIARFVAQHLPGYEIPGDPVSICHACAMVQRDPRAMEVARTHAAQIAGSIAERFVALQESFVLQRPAGRA